MKNIFILHGTEKTFYGATFDKVNKYFAERGRQVYVPTLPTVQGMNYKNWEKVLEGFLDAGLITKDTTFVCHGIAAVFLVKFILRHKSNIKRAVLVDGFYAPTGDASIDSAYADFFEIDLRSFKEYCSERICIYAQNGNKTVSFDVLKTFADFIYAESVYNQGGNSEVIAATLEQIIRYVNRR
ncbi:MAG: hypothetical protein LBN07_01825 [Christensenellaceae bacterium]|jgi:predicted alpha/beta hydrolase family esterase|nr:hypothetical protein [Christensenellaceae bacterium]